MKTTFYGKSIVDEYVKQQMKDNQKLNKKVNARNKKIAYSYGTVTFSKKYLQKESTKSFLEMAYQAEREALNGMIKDIARHFFPNGRQEFMRRWDKNHPGT